MNIKIVILFAIIGLIFCSASIYCYSYESRYTGLLPLISYPLRKYTLPLAVVGVGFLVASLILYLRMRRV